MTTAKLDRRDSQLTRRSGRKIHPSFAIRGLRAALPYFVEQYYEWSHRTNLLVQSLSQGSPALEVMNRLLKDGPDKPWAGVRPEPPGKLDELDLSGYEILQVSHTMDLRLWKTDVDGQNDSTSRVHIGEQGVRHNNHYRVDTDPDFCQWSNYKL